MPLGISISTRKYKASKPPFNHENSFEPVEGNTRPHHRSKKARDSRPLVFLADGITLSQQPGLQPLPGQVGLSCYFPQLGRAQHLPPAPPPQPTLDPNEDDTIMLISTFEGSGHSEFHDTTVEEMSRHRRRRLNQTRRWLDFVIPGLISPYMDLMHRTKSLRLDCSASTSFGSPIACTCNTTSRSLSISVVRFHLIELINITVCHCNTASSQLVSAGLFPSAPLMPSLAVDIRVLEFVSRLFLNIAPNTSAWCKTVEAFLDSQGYKLTFRDSLRKRFGEALRWYNVLQDHTNIHITKLLSITRKDKTLYDDGLRFDNRLHQQRGAPLVQRAQRDHTVPAEESAGLPASERNCQKRPIDNETNETANSNPFPDPVDRERPSDYLRSRCALCFGGTFPRPAECLGPDVIVCIDACFKQKRNKGEKEPCNMHPDSLFLSEASASRMDTYVQGIRPSATSLRARKRGKKSNNNDNDVSEEPEDGFDGPLRVPRSVLATCQESFTAADDSRQKASTQFFSETALMALLCRHDRVLWIVSMTSAGEKQHYTLALVETLFQHLPLATSVGLMYDIGCQLHLSCVKWGFLSRYLDRLTFAVSVFHAFGHQWACQIIYHPRKCTGFGLSDGEGCERLWKSIQTLIPYLRVCGHYQRLYTLDRQILSAEKESQQKLADWLLRRARHTHQKRIEAENAIADSGQQIEFLEEQWSLQVAFQTKPLPRQSKNKGKNAVEHALHLRKARDIVAAQIRQLQDAISDEFSESYVVAEAEIQLPELRDKLARAVDQCRAANAALGVDEKHRLQQLINNPFIGARMNARALKMRLREKLRSRKFELDRLERSFRHQVNERKVDEHTETAVQRRDPGIQKLARDYNKLCQTMYNLKASGRAPRGAICPAEIELSGLFALDVDDEIWQDVGLDDTLDEAAVNSAPPPWLSKEDVRNGIKGMLQLKRCIEEESRLKWELDSLKQWYAEEWKIVCSAMESIESDSEVLYQLELRKKELVILLASWKSHLQSITMVPFNLSDWGPTHDELLTVRIHTITPSYYQGGALVGVDTAESDGGDDFEDDGLQDADFFDSTLLDTLEAVDLADAFRSE